MLNILAILLLVCFVIALFMILFLYDKIDKLEKSKENNSNKQMINIADDLYSILGENINVKDKLKKLNDNIINEIKVKYSSVCIFDGEEYELITSNIDAKYIKILPNIAKDTKFLKNINLNTCKYLTSNVKEELRYKTSYERKIKSTLFIPLYDEQRYLGFVLLEDIESNFFDKYSKQDIKKLKELLEIFVEIVHKEHIFELAQNKDNQTGYYNNLYFYYNASNIIKKYDKSALVIIKLSNISQIIEKYNLNIANALIVKVTDTIRESVNSDVTLIRYTNNKLILIIPNENAQTAHKIIEHLYFKISRQVEYFEEERVSVEPQAIIHTIKKENNIEKELQKMLEYIKYIKKCNVIKII